jgi:hypothetical protein
MPELLAALDAFLEEHRRCGELDGRVEGAVFWSAGGVIAAKYLDVRVVCEAVSARR